MLSCGGSFLSSSLVVAKGRISPCCGVFKDHSNMATDIHQAHEVMGFISVSVLRGKLGMPGRWPHRRSTRGTGFTKLVGSQEGVKTQWQRSYWGSGWNKQGKTWGCFCVFEYLLVTARGKQERALVAGTSLTTLVTCSAGQGAHSLLVRVWRPQENRTLWKHRAHPIFSVSYHEQIWVISSAFSASGEITLCFIPLFC